MLIQLQMSDPTFSTGNKVIRPATILNPSTQSLYLPDKSGLKDPGLLLQFQNLSRWLQDALGGGGGCTGG